MDVDVRKDAAMEDESQKMVQRLQEIRSFRDQMIIRRIQIQRPGHGDVADRTTTPPKDLRTTQEDHWTDLARDRNVTGLKEADHRVVESRETTTRQALMTTVTAVNADVDADVRTTRRIHQRTAQVDQTTMTTMMTTVDVVVDVDVARGAVEDVEDRHSLSGGFRILKRRRTRDRSSAVASNFAHFL